MFFQTKDHDPSWEAKVFEGQAVPASCLSAAEISTALLERID